MLIFTQQTSIKSLEMQSTWLQRNKKPIKIPSQTAWMPFWGNIKQMERKTSRSGTQTRRETLPFPIPHSQEAPTKEECERLYKIKVSRKISHSTWTALTLTRPKKHGRVRFLSDARELNTRTKRKPKIQKLPLKLEGFTHAIFPDLNMDYYHVEQKNQRQ